MRRLNGDFLTRPARRGILACLVLSLVLIASSRGAQARTDLNYPRHVAVENSPKVQLGTATAERLGSIFASGAGPFTAARAGDWRLANEHLSVTFAGVEPTTAGTKLISMPLSGFRDVPAALRPYAGALLDVAVDGDSLDYVIGLTQYVGEEPRGNQVAYDEVKTVQRPDAVGLCFEGSPFDNSPLRLQTTYWLAPGSHRVIIESQMLNLPEGEAAPPVGDFAAWGFSSLLVNKHGEVFSANKLPMTTDFFQVQGGDISIGLAAAEGLKIKGTFMGSPNVTNTRYVPAVADDGNTTAARNNATTSTQAAAAPPATRPQDEATSGPVRRDLWLMRGTYADVLEKIQESRNVPTGTFAGVVRAAKENTTQTQAAPAGTPNADKVTSQAGVMINVMYTDRFRPEEHPPVLYTRVKTDRNGRYSVKLPDGFFFMIPQTKSQSPTEGGLLRSGLPSPIGKSLPRVNLQAGAESGLRVRVVDAATSKPLAARLRFENIPPTPPVNLGYPLAAEGYFDNAYIPAEGGVVSLPPGKWIVNAWHGITYDSTDRDVLVLPGQITELVLSIRQSSPTPGWVHVETGVRTKATPGCMIEAHDIVLMCAAEGIDWAISGDFESLTDLRPAIRELGLEGKMGASRGFRTILPAHPEWGQFLVYPVAEDAPDPATARDQWAGLKTAGEFIATLRKLYPGALIQSELPYTEDGLGYFARHNKDAFEISWEPPAEIEQNIDAISLLPSRQQWDYRFIKGFYFGTLIRGKNYLASCSNNGSVLFGAEPGYPRLLACLGQDAKVTEEALFAAVKAHRTQLTTGPFIDYNINGVLPGGLVPFDESLKMHVRVTAPNWIDTSSMVFDKEDHMRISRTLGGAEGDAQRFPEIGQEDEGIPVMTLKDMDLVGEKDTLVSISVFGTNPLKGLPALSAQDIVNPFALVTPIVVDTISNGKYDPLKSYIQRGT